MDVPVLFVVLALIVAFGYVLGWAWLIRRTIYDWDEMSVLVQAGSALAVTVLSIPLSIFMIGFVGFLWGIILFFRIGQTSH